jgi:hypothetical protein
MNSETKPRPRGFTRKTPDTARPIESFVEEALQLVRQLVELRRELAPLPGPHDSGHSAVFLQLDRVNLAYYDEVSRTMTTQLEAIVAECPTVTEIVYERDRAIEENAHLRAEILRLRGAQ